MTDKQLLALAAKAAGATRIQFCAGALFNPFNETGNIFWNPLLEDGDALRLAVKLCMQVECSKGWQHVTAYGHNFRMSEMHNGKDPEKATRRAIVRAAAEIGKEIL